MIRENGLSRNLVAGSERAEYFFTAHYDTPGRTGFLLFAAPLVGQALANLASLFAAFAVLLAARYLPGFLPVSNAAVLWVRECLLLLILLPMVVPMLIKNRNNRNDNTSGVLSVIQLADAIAHRPELRERCCFILFDNEEWGLLGSSAYAKWCAKNNISFAGKQVINLDCVGDGDLILTASFAPKNPNQAALTNFLKSKGHRVVQKVSRAALLSDHINFNNGVMVSLVKRSALGPVYLPKIHTKNDVNCDINKIEELCASLVEYITR